MNNHLIKHIQQCTHLTDATYTSIYNHFSVATHAKKKMLLSAGEICKFEGFVNKGCVKTYYIDQNGFEVILTFATEGWWISDLYSFEEQLPSSMFIETLEETELLYLTPNSKAGLLTKHPELEKMFRLMIQKHLHSYQERLFGNIALSAEERYDNFLLKYPNLPQRIPQHLIASFLGISAEFLSRLRKRKSKK